GGDFYWVDGGSDEYGHNVAELPNATADSIIADNLPPGFDSTVGAGIGSSWSGNQLSCAGTYGCHGTHSAGDKWAAMKGAHHNNSSGTILAGASSTGESYRFLDGIAGIEDSDWQWTESASDHNDYKGTDDATDRQFDIGTTDYAASAAAGTISYLCAQCHGAFHAKAADDSVYAAGDPWRRHPTDIALPSNAGSEYSAYDNYSVEAPIGRPDLTTIPDNSLVVEGTDIVLCLSCHRAHGSDQPDLLRWDYSTQIAGDSLSGGCFTCHTTK
ncbi:MAG: cytochrome c3 family protein, partial [Nitrospirota bacterium]